MPKATGWTEMLLQKTNKWAVEEIVTENIDKCNFFFSILN